MKRRLSLGLLLASITISINVYSNYVFIGLQGKLTSFDIKETSSYVSPFGRTVTVDKLGVEPAPQATLFGGLNTVFNDKYLFIINLFGDLNTIKRVESSDPGATSIIYLKNKWGLSFEPGVLIQSATELYLRLGFADARFQRVATGITSPMIDETLLGALYGLGARYRLNAKLLAGFDLSYFLYKESSNSQGATDAFNGRITAKWDPVVTSANLSLIYQFG